MAGGTISSGNDSPTAASHGEAIPEDGEETRPKSSLPSAACLGTKVTRMSEDGASALVSDVPSAGAYEKSDSASSAGVDCQSETEMANAANVDVESGAISNNPFEDGVSETSRKKKIFAMFTSSSLASKESKSSGRRERRSTGRGSSLELRKVPEHIVLGPDWEGAELNLTNRGVAVLDDISEDAFREEEEGEMPKFGILQRTCLRPQYSLRTQLMLSFGVVSTMTVLFVMIISIIISISAGQTVERSAKENLEQWAQGKASLAAQDVSDAFTPMLPGDVSEILLHVARDRFVGYPDAEGYESDDWVPFRDMESGMNMYPIDAPPLPLDWQIGKGNVDGTNFREHVGERRGWYGSPESTVLSTASAFFSMQGACDPSVSDPAHKNYHVNCTEDSNKISTGGAVSPSPLAASIHAKGKDLSPVLKALYESTPMIKLIGLFFSNGGAGAGIAFPHQEVDSTKSFTSIGCEWMREENPLLPGEPIGTEEDIGRCHQQDKVVSVGEFNAMERSWCRDMALNPGRIHFVGPYLDAWSDHLWLMSVGQAVYDRRTEKFTGCIVMDISVEKMTDVLEMVKSGETSLITLVKWDDDGTVVSSPNWDFDAADEVTTVDNPELGTGLSADDFTNFKNLVNFSTPWESENVREKYKSEVLEKGTKIVSSYPVPPPPESYDESYMPSFMVIVTLEKSEVFQPFYNLGDAIDEEVRGLIIFTAIVGFAGLVGIFWIILAVSILITRPLHWMKEASDKIIDNFGGNESTLPEGAEKDRIDQAQSCMNDNFGAANKVHSDRGVGTASKADNSNAENKAACTFRGKFVSCASCLKCAPKTELTDLTREFQRMVSQFSADGAAAKAVRLGSKLTDVRNCFTLQTEFDELYESRKDSRFKYNFGEDTAADSFDDTNGVISTARSVSFGTPKRVHYGPNIIVGDDTSRSVSTMAILSGNDGPVVKSRLFRWIVVLVVTPLLLVTIIISAVVIVQVSNYSTSLDNIVKAEYIRMEEQAATTAADLHSIHASQVMEKASRDLHVLSRFAGWLLFDGLNRTNSFSSMHTAAEECKTAGGPQICDDVVNSVCDCSLNDITADTCVDYPKSNDTRYLQELVFEGQSQDALPNGDRNFVPVQFEATMPNKTAWWADPLNVSGYENGSSAHGYETTYDRLRVISATSAILMPLYNYDNSRDKSLSLNVGFEADGMMVGYGGCGHGHADMSYWQSSEKNGAADLRPDLCPLGKYGYDARCRDWYHTGKQVAENEEAPLYVAPPYTFAVGNELVAQSATIPLIDSRTGEYVGTTLLDFMSTAIFSSMNEKRHFVRGGFPVLITTRTDVFKHDTVIGPNFTLGIDAARVEEVVVPYDWTCALQSTEMCSSGTDFDEIAEFMRAGKSGASSFIRTAADGKKERMYISYAPVNVTSLRPLNHSDFSRGAERFSSLVYSLAFVQPEAFLLAPFGHISEDINHRVNIYIGVLAAVVVVATAFLIYISARVTVSITVPILGLLKMIKSINRLENKEDFTPPADGSGSSEVSAVYNTFSMLFKVVRFANAAFFSGDIEKAYWVLVDALRLFRSLDNKKAIGVASNNLGNCMLTMYRRMKVTGEPHICGLSRTDIISKGTAYFREAIKLGEEAYDKFYEEQGWSGSCLVFMQHLSSRYFNRAIFFLTVKNDHKFPEEANRLGFRDLDISKSMDVEVVDQSLEAGFSVNKSELFDLMLNRIRGVLSLMDMGYPDEWGVDEQINDAFQELRRALKTSSSDFFLDVSPAGRMQELEAELIKHAQLTNMTEEAAMIGIRMLVEDEYAFHYAELSAVNAIINYVSLFGEEKGLGSDVKQAIVCFKDDIEAGFKDTVLHRISDVQSSEENILSSLKSSMVRASSMSLDSHISSSVRESCRGDFTMEIF